MIPITYLKGDATEPVGGGEKYLVHVVNDIARWGAGITRLITLRWPEVSNAYLGWGPTGATPFRLGENQYVRVRGDLCVVNMLAQRGVRSQANPRPVSYAALALCLWQLRFPIRDGLSVHMPRIGCGLGGGDWAVVEQLVIDALCRHEIPVYVYDLEAK